MNRYLILITRSLAAIICMLSIYILVMLAPEPLALDIMKMSWTALMVSLVYLLVHLAVKDFREQD